MKTVFVLLFAFICLFATAFGQNTLISFESSFTYQQLTYGTADPRGISILPTWNATDGQLLSVLYGGQITDYIIMAINSGNRGGGYDYYWGGVSWSGSNLTSAWLQAWDRTGTKIPSCVGGKPIGACDTSTVICEYGGGYRTFYVSKC